MHKIICSNKELRQRNTAEWCLPCEMTPLTSIILPSYIGVQTSITKLLRIRQTIFLSVKITMRSLFKRDHFILGYANNGILYIKNGQDISFDKLNRLGYDSSKAIDSNNNLLEHVEKIKVSLFMPMRRNLWLAPLFTVVSASPLNQEEVSHLYRFCKLMGGVNITVSHVSSIKEFLEQPSLKLIRQNYFSC